MVVLKTSRELKAMRDAGRISSRALKLAGEAVEPGVSTLEIDRIVRKYIEEQGATPSFLNYGGFPASACISVNDVVIHGIPRKNQILKQGDIVSIDVGAFYEGFHGDNAWTFPCGEVSKEAQALMDVTRESLFEGIMTIAIEPMVNQGVHTVETLSDNWSVVTSDGKLSAHFEHTIAITPDGPVILTLPD